MDQRTPAFFLADALGLDFINSVATPLDSPVDWISDGDGLLAWLGEAGLVPSEVLADIKHHALPGELDKVAERARSLREWARRFVLRHQGKPLFLETGDELAPLNRLLELDEPFSRIALKDGRPELHALRRWRTSDSLLMPIGEAIARLLTDEDFTHVKQCEGPSCTLLFADHTRGHARRWCDMAICGNRAKQAAHRHRVKELLG